MFFYLSKIVWTFAQPLSLIGLAWFVSLVALVFAWRKTALVLGTSAFLALAVLSWTTAGDLLLLPLEQRFARPQTAPARVDGIIVLGGAFEGGVNLARPGYELNEAGDRMVEAAALAIRYPDARLLVSGGSGTLLREREGDADTAPSFFSALGIDPARLILEPASRTTDENATASKALVDPQPGETWLLVTSAYHMPRSVGLFRRVGWPVVPWPTDYRTAGDETLGLCQENGASCLRSATVAFREWLGLVAYWLTGRIDEWFPTADPRSET